MKEFLGRIFTPALTECYGCEICPCRLMRLPHVARADEDDGRIDQVALWRGEPKAGGGGRVARFWRVLVRGGGRLGWLEGVPFQTLRIDLFVDGTPSLHPVLVVVDHVLKLFQRFLLSRQSPRATRRSDCVTVKPTRDGCNNRRWRVERELVERLISQARNTARSKQFAKSDNRGKAIACFCPFLMRREKSRDKKKKVIAKLSLDRLYLDAITRNFILHYSVSVECPTFGQNVFSLTQK